LIRLLDTTAFRMAHRVLSQDGITLAQHSR